MRCKCYNCGERALVPHHASGRSGGACTNCGCSVTGAVMVDRMAAVYSRTAQDKAQESAKRAFENEWRLADLIEGCPCCQGDIYSASKGSCTCHLGRPPCLSCTDTVYRCNTCGMVYHQLPSEVNKPKGQPGMNKSLSIFLVSDQVRLIKGVFGRLDDSGKRLDAEKEYSYKTFDPSIKRGDLVVVPVTNGSGFSVVTVTQVDIQGDIDYSLNDGIDYKWVAGKFDRSFYDKGIAEEAKLLEAVAHAEREAKKKELREKMLEHMPDEQKQLLLGASPSGIDGGSQGLTNDTDKSQA